MQDLPNKSQQLANEIGATLLALNEKLREAENAGLCILAKVNKFKNISDSAAKECTRIEAAVMLPITPNFEN